MPPARKPGSFRFYPKRQDAREKAPDWNGYFNTLASDGEESVTYRFAIWREEDGGFSGRFELKDEEQPF